MNDLLSPEAIGQALVPFVVAFVSLAVSVFTGFVFLNNRNRKEINRVDQRNVELTAENEKFRQDLRDKEDDLHAMRRELDDLRVKLDERDRRLELLTVQLTELSGRATKLEDRLSDMQGLLESERKFAQGRIDAESIARQKAELKATQLQSQVDVLRTEKDALAQRLEDQALAHRSQIEMLQQTTARLESESRLLSASIEDRVRSATLKLVEQIEGLKQEREALERRVKELESKGADPDA